MIFGFVAVSSQRLQISEVSWVLHLVLLYQSYMLPVVFGPAVHSSFCWGTAVETEPTLRASRWCLP